MIQIIKGIIFGKQNKDKDLRPTEQSVPQVLVATSIQNDPNHQREILRKKALLLHNRKIN